MAALGIIETKGHTAALAAADAMNKTAAVQIYIGDNAPIRTGGLIAVIIKADDVGSVKAAVEAGAEAAKSVGGASSVHVIARINDAAAKALGVDPGDNTQWE